MNNEVVILIYCETGFGDHYASIITGYNHLKNIKSMGYNPKILISKGHKYFPMTIPLSVVYNFSSFDSEIIESPYNEIDIYLNGLEKIYSSEQGQIWVKSKTEDLLKYVNSFKSINRYYLNRLENEPLNGEPFFIDQIYKNSENLMKDKENVIGIHFRGDDYIINSSLESVLNNEKWSIDIQRISKIIEENKLKNIFLSSINRNISIFFENKYKNVFTYKFSNEDLPTHNICGNYEHIEDMNPYIENSIDILSEMVSFSYCEKIYSYSNFPSSFLLYGIINNKIHTDWYSKNFKIVE